MTSRKRTAGAALSAALIVLGLAVLAGPAAAEALPSGREIAERINARDEGNAVSRKLVMEMVAKSGKKRVRETIGFRKYYGKEKRTVIFYRSPTNVKGTGFLTFDYPEADKDDDQWLYLPALRKVRRISASDRGDYFLGTDFSYEDIKKENKVTIEDYDRKTIGEDEVDGHRTYVVEQIPVSKDVATELGYGRVVAHVDAEIWMIRKSEFWDVRGNPLKTTHFRDIRKVQGIWTAHRIEVKNHKTGHATTFLFSEVDYAGGVDDSAFTKRALKRGF